MGAKPKPSEPKTVLEKILQFFPISTSWKIVVFGWMMVLSSILQLAPMNVFGPTVTFEPIDAVWWI